MKHTLGLAAAFFALLPAIGHAQNTGVTSNFKQDATSKLPISASTAFEVAFSGTGANPDPLNTAEHELLHAIGFTRNYTLFHARETTRPDGAVNFKDSKGNLLAILTGVSTHIDTSKTLPGAKAKQNDLMRPDQVVGQRASALDKSILNAAFNWSGKGGLNINVIFSGKWSAADKTIINNAVTADAGLFGGGKKNAFAWTVTSTQPAPEASSLVLLGGLIALGAVRLRRKTGTAL